MSPETFADSLTALEGSVRRDPESGLAWSLLAFLYNQSYALQFMPMEAPLDKAVGAAQKGVLLEPESQVTRASQGSGEFSL